MNGAIDIVVNLRTPKVIAAGLSPTDADFQKQTRQSASTRRGVEIPDYLRLMDEAGIERSLLIAVRCGPHTDRRSVAIPYEWVADVCEQYPDRFSGVAGIDPTLGMQQLAELRSAVRELGFVGAHYYPHWFHLRPDAPPMYPIYATCCELDLPLMMQVGQNLIYQKDVRLPSVAQPYLLDQVAIDFPGLKLIGIHIGVPWADEMIAMATKHENLYIGGDAYAPAYWPASLIRYLQSDGRRKVLFGTDWPVIDPVRAVRDVEALKLPADTQRLLMRDNASALFGLATQAH